MHITRSTLWSGNILIDAFPRPPWPWMVAACALGLVVLIDAALGLALRAGTLNDAHTLSNPRQVRSVLAAAANTARGGDAAVWVLMGDSVLVGDSVRETIPDWDQHRVIDYMRRETARATPVHYYQAALNGILPVDLLQLVRELDRQDPAGRAGVVIELNLRYFSPHYTEQETCTRPWLDQLAPRIVTGNSADWPALALLETRRAAEGLHDATPVLRHRDALAGLWDAAAWPPVFVPEVDPVPAETMTAFARMDEHFRTPVLRGDFAQLNAFREVLRHLAASGRPALLFSPPLNDAHAAEAMKPGRYAEDLGLLAQMVDEEGGTAARLVSMDHPIFDRRMFQDIAHMYPAGNRLLALNLMHALNVPFETPPEATALIYPEGTDLSLIWNIQPGSRNGAPWQAAMRAPNGIVVVDGRCVLADTGNHCLRVFDEQIGLLRTLAGAPGEGGWEDGSLSEARFDSPFAPEAMDGDLYCADAGGRRLRRIHRGRVMTEGARRGPPWTAIRALRSRAKMLYLLDGADRILEYDPESMASRDLTPAHPWTGIAAFDVTPDGRLFVADEKGRIWLADLAVADRDAEAFTLFFENVAEKAIPDRGYFPFAFEEMRLNAIQDLQYLPRYNGLLVQDYLPPKTAVRDFDEGYHLRFLGLGDRRIYPWVTPQVTGGYVLRNDGAGTWVSPYRQGSFTLSESGSTLYYLERNRTHLYRQSDGLWAASKIGQIGNRPEGEHAPDLFGPYAGAYTYYNHLPDRYLAGRVERVPRSGPYLGLMTGPSIISTSDVEQNYSLARGIEQRLQRQLGLGSGARFDLIVRSEPGMGFERSVDLFTEFVALGGRLDVAIFSLRNVFDLSEDSGPGAQFERIVRAAERFDTRILFIDFSPLFTRFKDSLRPPSQIQRKSRAFVEAAGFEVVKFGNAMLAESLGHFPAGSPPFAEHHAAPWAIDQAADLLAARLYPILKTHFRDRVPALRRLAPLLAAPEFTLRSVIEEFESVWGVMPTVVVPASAVQRRYASGHLALLLDLNKVGAYRSGLSEAGVARITWSTLRQYLRDDLAGRLATTVSLRMATFANYDEYGEGVASSATVLQRIDLDTIDLEAYLDNHLKTAAAAPE